MIDIDDFKKVNDRHGHQAGDVALREFATGWYEAIRQGSDYIARVGGDEFGVLAPGTTERGAPRLAKRLRAISPRGLSCSVGVATWDRAESAEQLVHRADEAMYRAKREHQGT
jgi:diguanylate cyclase (GGDEF)-like protein